jgi:hypothetical protein
MPPSSEVVPPVPRPELSSPEALTATVFPSPLTVAKKPKLSAAPVLLALM